ncbi:MAG: hypothetical protein HQL32_04100 [Planctomycetes bacterium]|nr:hypothetical protein [Planctomycetota bacterium]
MASLLNHRHFALGLSFLTALALFYFLGTGLLREGYSSWSQKGDAHFYAKCSEHFLESGNFRWFELYPIALKKDHGTEMVWTAIAFPGAAALLASVSSLSAQEAVVGTSVLFLLLSLVLMFGLGSYLEGGYLGLLLVAAVLCSEYLLSYGCSGSSETTSLFFLLAALSLMVLYQHRPSSFCMVALFLVLFLGCYARPQNQFFLIALPMWVFVQSGLFKWRWLIAVPLLLGAFFALNRMMVGNGQITFPYSFSFLVGCPPFPGHQLFREYWGGFGLAQVLERQDYLWDKALLGWYVLKQYWTEWLPHLLFLSAAALRGKYRGLARVVFLTLMASLFFSAMGHLVPRYWRLLEPLTFVLLCLVTYERFSAYPHWTRLLAAQVLLSGFTFLYEPPYKASLEGVSLESQLAPQALLEKLPADGLVACNRPARIIDGIKRAVLLCPQDPVHLQRIHNQVEPVNALVFSPDLYSPKSELKLWAARHFDEDLMKLGFRLVYEEDNWLLYLR